MINLAKKVTQAKAIKFLISGISAAGFEYIVFIILSSLYVNILLANTISFIGGLFLSFLLNKNWVFNDNNGAKSQFIKYLLLAGVNIILSNLIILFTVHVIGLNPLVAKFITMILVAAWNYIIYSKIIFTKQSALTR